MTGNASQQGAELRIMRNGNGWYWEVITEGNRVESRGVADTEASARRAATDAARKAQLVT